jgi:hypothetical protein
MKRTVPDRAIAIGLFLLLLGVYLWTHNDRIEQMMLMAFGLVTFAISEGLKRMSESFKARLERLESKGGGRRSTDAEEG